MKQPLRSYILMIVGLILATLVGSLHGEIPNQPFLQRETCFQATGHSHHFERAITQTEIQIFANNSSDDGSLLHKIFRVLFFNFDQIPIAVEADNDRDTFLYLSKDYLNLSILRAKHHPPTFV